MSYRQTEEPQSLSEMKNNILLRGSTLRRRGWGWVVGVARINELRENWVSKNLPGRCPTRMLTFGGLEDVINC